MKMKKAFVLLACLLVASGCARGGQAERLVGKWKPVGAQRGGVLEFKRDGTLTTPHPESGRAPIQGRYEIEGGNKLKITATYRDGFPETVVWQIEFTEDGKRMRFKEEPSRVSGVFERVE